MVRDIWRQSGRINAVEPPQTFHFDGPPDFGLVGDLEIAAGGMVEIRACSECNYIAPSHRPNCSHNFQKRAPTICADCGVDLDQTAHAAGCLRLNQPVV
jgi:hypothetical protein